MSSRDEILKWTNEAFDTLEVAQKLSSVAHTSLTSTTDLLTGTFPSRIKDGLSKYEQASEKFSSVMATIKDTQNTVFRATSGHEKIASDILQPALRNMETVLGDLHRIEVPSFLVKETGEKGTHCLDAFISHDEINKLRSDIDAYLGNCETVISLLRRESDEVITRQQEKTVEFRSLSGIYEGYVVPCKPLLKYAGSDVSVEKTPLDHVGTVLKENHSLGSELTNLLEMLTKHFDQCSLAVEWMKTRANEEIVDIHVLKNDSEELPEVLREVRAICDIITQNEKKACGIYEPKRKILDIFIKNCMSLIDWCIEFEANDMKKLLLVLVNAKVVYNTGLTCDKAQQENSQKDTLQIENSQKEMEDHILKDVKALKFDHFPLIEEYAQTLSTLSDHYRQFYSVYQAQYLSELHYEQYVYPRKVLKLLDDFLNTQLLQLENEEHERRHEWMRKYGQFIPSNFVLPGESQYPRVVQVVSEGIDHLESKNSHNEEEKLLEVIRNSLGRS